MGDGYPLQERTGWPRRFEKRRPWCGEASRRMSGAGTGRRWLSPVRPFELRKELAELVEKQEWVQEQSQRGLLAQET